MCPTPYYTLMRQSTNKFHLRLEMVRYADQHGVKPAARVFHTTPKTVRKWLRRWQQDGHTTLHDQSRAPLRPATYITPEQRAEAIRWRKLCPRWSAERLRRDYGLTLSEKALYRIWREEGLMPRRKRKHRTKQDLRAVKAQWRLFEQTCVDTKDLDDIPEYYLQMRAARLPVVQYTAREVVSGLQFLAFAQERSLTYATLFIQGILQHLQRCGVPLANCRIQTDNGSEFIGSWNAKHDSSFTKAVEAVPGLRHHTIPPKAHTWQADVETVHRLIEDEFYEVETFPARKEFLVKVTSYLLWFNAVRKNRSKQHKTPWEIIQEREPTLKPDIVMLPPVFLDDIWQPQTTKTITGGYDVVPYP